MINNFQDQSESGIETRRLKKIATYLDSQFHLPFGWRIGWDGIIGMIPGAGDLVTNGISFYIVYRAALIGCPPSVILRMCLNILIDNFLDLIPFVGIVFDFMWKSNLKNVELLEKYLDKPDRTRVASVAILIFTVIFAIAVICGSIFLTFSLLFKLLESLQTTWSA